MNTKQLAGERAVTYIKDGMTVGLGTGSTAYWAIKKIGERVVAENLKIICTATSLESERLAKDWKIPVQDIAEISKIDLTIDGADEIDPQLNMIKGGGGALLREKIIAGITKEYIIVVDETKFVTQLGAFGVPVEVTQFGWERTAEHLISLGATTTCRQKNSKTFITDNGNFIIDCHFGFIQDAASLETAIQNIPGVVVCGLFINRTNKLIIGKDDGSVQEIG